MLEKIAVNLMAGVPAIVKPATITCFLTEMMVREIVESGIKTLLIFENESAYHLFYEFEQVKPF